jgi:hypothetical protein
VFATRGGLANSLCGLSTGFGATTVTVGSVVDEPPVCDMAVPPGANSNTVDRIATAEGAIRLDEILMTHFPKSGRKCRPGADTHLCI